MTVKDGVQIEPLNNYIQKRNEYLGRALDGIVQALGTPCWEGEFKVLDASDEKRWGLRTLLPKDGSTTENVMIKELFWRDGDYFLTLWFHQVNHIWIVLDTLYWHKDVTF